MAKGVWGIDVSKSSVKAVRIQSTKEGLQLTDVEIINYPPAVGRDDAAIEQEIRTAISNLTSRHKIKGDIVVASLPGHAIFNRFVKIPAINKDRLESIIKYEAQQHIPFPIEDVIWVYQVIEKPPQTSPESDKAEEEIEVVFFAIKKELVDQFLALMAASNLNVDIIQFAPVALYNFVLFNMPATLTRYGTVVLDMGANNSDLILMEGNKFMIRNLPIVGNTITKSIQDKLEIAYADAERLKTTTTVDHTQEAGKVFGAVQSVLKDLASEIHRTIGFYKSMSSGRTAHFKNMVLAGSATKMIYFEEFLSQRLQLEVSRMTGLNNIEVSGKIDKALLEGNLSALGVAFGLAIQGFGRTLNRINLMPPELLRVKTLGRKKAFVVATACVLLLVTFLLHLSAKTVAGQYRNLYADIDKTIKDAKKIEEQFKAIKDTAQKEEYLKTVSAIGAGRDTYVKLLNALGKIEPLTRSAIAPDKGYIEADNTEDEAIFKQNEKNKIWLLNLKMETTTDTAKAYLICGVVARQKQNGEFDSVASQEFVKEQLVKPLAQEFTVKPVEGETDVKEPKDSISLVISNPIQRLLTKDEMTLLGGQGDEEREGDKTALAATTGKYYLFQIQLTIPIN